MILLFIAISTRPLPSPPVWGRGLPASGGAEGDQGRGEGAEQKTVKCVRISQKKTVIRRA
jgi:hypothetical protein